MDGWKNMMYCEASINTSEKKSVNALGSLYAVSNVLGIPTFRESSRLSPTGHNTQQAALDRGHETHY